jgi:protoporphyrinogen oxidase
MLSLLGRHHRSAAALRILSEPNPPRVTIFESLNRVGGVIHASPFAGIASLDESADAFLTRTPSAIDLIKQVGLGDALTSPATGEAYIWQNALHPIPHGTSAWSSWLASCCMVNTHSEHDRKIASLP